MALTLRIPKGSPLTYAECDANFSGLADGSNLDAIALAAKTFTSLALSASLTVGDLTAGRVPYASTGGLIVDSSLMTFDATNKILTVGDGATDSIGVVIGYSGTSGISGIWSTRQARTISNALIADYGGVTTIGGSARIRVAPGGSEKFAVYLTGGHGALIDAGVATADVNALNITQTWNNGAVTFTSIKADITDTASDAASLLMDLRVDGVSRVAARKDSRIIFNDGTVGGQIGLVTGLLNSLSIYRQDGIEAFRFNGHGGNERFFMTSQWIGFGSSASPDLSLHRVDASTFEINNSTQGQYRDLRARTLFPGGGATVTVDTPMVNGSQTWNNGAVAFTAIKADITDTASNAASLLMDLQVGGVSQFNVVKNGTISYGGTGIVHQIIPKTSNIIHFFRASDGFGSSIVAGNQVALSNGFEVRSGFTYDSQGDREGFFGRGPGPGSIATAAFTTTGMVGWTASATEAYGVFDTAISRISAGVIGVGTGAAASIAGSLSLTNITAAGTLTYGGVTLTNAVTGTGKMVLDTSPTLITPALGTPSSGVISACTSTSMVMVTPVLGTPTSGNLSNCTADGTDNVGFLEIPQNSKSVAYELVLADSGKHIFHPSADTTARIWTIPANASVAFPIGTAVTFINQISAGVITIAITTDTMYLAGAGTTGSRTLAAHGIATAVKMTATTWIISGTGLT